MSSEKYQMAVAQMKTQLYEKAQQVDSLHAANRILSDRLSTVDNKNRKTETSEIRTTTIYVRDTLYVTELKVEKQIVDRVIRDTIVIEVPLLTKEQPAMAESNDVDRNNKSDHPQSSEAANKSSSIQFNFSESGLINK